jgi:small nuclear ribonucleoprotein E
MPKELQAILPLEAMYKLMKGSVAVEIWERETDTKHAGRIVGFDEYMNVTLEGGGRRFVLKGDCISAIIARE